MSICSSGCNDAADYYMSLACQKRLRNHSDDVEKALGNPDAVGKLKGYSKTFSPPSEDVFQELQNIHRRWFRARRCELILGVAATALAAFVSALAGGLVLAGAGLVYLLLYRKVNVIEDARSLAYLVLIQSRGSKGEDPRLGKDYTPEEKKNITDSMITFIEETANLKDKSEKFKEAATKLKNLIVRFYVEHLVDQADQVDRVMRCFSRRGETNEKSGELWEKNLPDEFIKLLDVSA